MSAPPLYVREGSRFVVYDAGRQHTPPIPVPRPLDDDGGLLGVPDPEQPNRTILPVERCPHGSFARWAASNCCSPDGRTRRRRT